MKKHEFYAKYADTPLGDRFHWLTLAHNSPIFRMTLHEIYLEIKEIDDRLREDEIRREKLLREVEPFLIKIHPQEGT